MPAVNAVTIIGMEPIIIVLVGLIFFREKTPLLVFALGVIAFIGVLLVVGKPEQTKDSAALIGSGLVFFFGFCHGFLDSLVTEISTKFRC